MFIIAYHSINIYTVYIFIIIIFYDYHYLRYRYISLWFIIIIIIIIIVYHCLSLLFIIYHSCSIIHDCDCLHYYHYIYQYNYKYEYIYIHHSLSLSIIHDYPIIMYYVIHNFPILSQFSSWFFPWKIWRIFNVGPSTSRPGPYQRPCPGSWPLQDCLEPMPRMWKTCAGDATPATYIYIYICVYIYILEHVEWIPATTCKLAETSI